jgi:hypothetical protein
MTAPQQPSRRDNEPVEAVPPQHEIDPVSGPDGYSGDQDIDTAGTEADDESTAAGPARKRGRATPPDASFADAPDNERPPIGPSDPGSMHRREDDEEAMAHSPDFHDTTAPAAGRPAIDRHR